MAWTSVGFDGTINEAQWSQMAGLLGNDYVAAGNGDCVVTAVGGARSVSVAAGSLYGDGVVSTNSGAETVAMTTPVNGQWYVIALRRTWATNTAALVAIAGATTTTTTPTAPPTSFPTLNTNKGVLTDQPIAWAWCNSANTTVVVYDIRLKAVKSLPPVVANQGERDAKFMTPTQGVQVWRDDLGAVETYFGLYNASTNPGGLDSAGWTTDSRQTGLVPLRPTTVTIASGSGSVSALGVITFTNATAINIDGIFSTRYTNYRMIVKTPTASTASAMGIRFRNAGVDNSSSNYFQTWFYNYYGGTTQTNNGGPATGAAIFGWAGGITGDYHQWIGDITSPSIAAKKTVNGLALGSGGSGGAQISSSVLFNSNAITFDGITLYPQAGTASGTIQILGYND